MLIDCGVSFARLKKAFELNSLDINGIMAVFITHEHHDHICGLKTLTKKTGLPVYAAPRTLDYLYDKEMIFSTAKDITDSISIDNITVKRFDTSHDARESCGYRISFADSSECCICTDLGIVSDSVLQAVSGCSAALIEANYDENMLRCGPYPAELKRRIRSDYGHLSNSDSGEFAAKLVQSGTTRLILGHLSEENNSPMTAESTVESLISEKGFQRGRDYLLSCAMAESTGGFVAF